MTPTQRAEIAECAELALITADLIQLRGEMAELQQRVEQIETEFRRHETGVGPRQETPC